MNTLPRRLNILALLLGAASVLLYGVLLYRNAVLPFFVMLFGIIVIGALLVFIAKKPDRIVYVMICYVVFQNFFAIILAKYGSYSASSGFIIMKDATAYLALAIAMFANAKRIKFTLPDWFAIIYGVTLVIYLVTPGDATLYLKLVQFRQLLTPVVLYLLGRYLLLDSNRLQTFLKFIINIAVIATLFGYLERFILGDNFWLTIGITEYLDSKGQAKWAYLGGLPGNFYSYDLYAYIGTTIRRIASFIADPPLFGQFLVLPITLLLFTRIITGKKRVIYSIILILAVLLALSKGGILALTIALVYKTFRSRFRVFGFIFMALMVVVVGAVLQNPHMINSLPAHMEGLTHNFYLAFNGYPFGLGLGEAGNITTLQTESSGSETMGAGESYVGMIVGQLGLLGFFFIFFIFSLFNLYRKFYTTDEYYKGVFVAIPAALIGTVAASMLSESAISFISAGVFFLLAGATVKTGVEVNEKNQKKRRNISWN